MLIIKNKVLLTPDEKRQVESDANFLLDSAGIKKPPISILDIVRLAIPYSKVILAKDTPEGIKGITLFGSGVCDILINESYPEVVQRFTAGHELGHALERESGCRLNKDGDLVMAKFQERRADYWAACLLMPEWMIRTYWNMFPLLNTQELYTSIEKIESRVAKLASIFEVSRPSMIIQLKDFGLIPVNTYFKLYKPYRNWME